jgi:hypothetical protein
VASTQDGAELVRGDAAVPNLGLGTGSVALSPDGRIAVFTGTVFVPGRVDRVPGAVAFSTEDGRMLWNWTAAWGGPGVSYVDNDGNTLPIFLDATRMRIVASTSTVTVRGNFTGGIESVTLDAASGKILSDASHLTAPRKAFAVSPDGAEIYAWGMEDVRNASAGFRTVVVALDAGSGAALWCDAGGWSDRPVDNLAVGAATHDGLLLLRSHEDVRGYDAASYASR